LIAFFGDFLIVLIRLKYFIIKKLDLLIKKNDTQIVICAENLSDNIFYFYIYLSSNLLLKNNITLLTKEKNYDVLKTQFYKKLELVEKNEPYQVSRNIKFISFNSILGFKYYLKAKYVIMQTSDGYFQSYFSNNSKKFYINFWHGIPMKTIGNLNIHNKNRNVAKQNFYWDVFLVSSEIEKKFMKNAFNINDSNIKKLGAPRYEYLLKNKNNIKFINKIKEHILTDIGFIPKKIVLYAPTYRKWSETLFFPFQNFDLKDFELFCYENNILFILRIHKFEKKNVTKLQDLLKSKYVILADHLLEMQDYLLISDILITDYSSSIFDMILLDKPIYLIPYDYDDYKEKRGFTDDFSGLINEFKLSDMKDLREKILLDEENGHTYLESIRVLKSTYHEYLLINDYNLSNRIYGEIINNDL